MTSCGAPSRHFCKRMVCACAVDPCCAALCALHHVSHPAAPTTGLTQGQLAQDINISPSQISQWLTGKLPPSSHLKDGSLLDDNVRRWLHQRLRPWETVETTSPGAGARGGSRKRTLPSEQPPLALHFKPSPCVLPPAAAPTHHRGVTVAELLPLITARVRPSSAAVEPPSVPRPPADLATVAPIVIDCTLHGHRLQV